MRNKVIMLIAVGALASACYGGDIPTFSENDKSPPWEVIVPDDVNTTNVGHAVQPHKYSAFHLVTNVYVNQYCEAVTASCKVNYNRVLRNTASEAPIIKCKMTAVRKSYLRFPRGSLRSSKNS